MKTSRFGGAGRVLTTIVTTAMAVAGLGALTAAPAAAATGPQYNVVDRPATAVTADALPTVQIDGVVWDQVIAGDTVFAGGQFAYARPAGAAVGTNQTPRGNLLSFNLRTGVLNTGFAPVVNGRIRAMTLSPDKTRLYVVGSFDRVNDVVRNRVAAFNVSDGSLVTSFAPSLTNDVTAVVATNNAVYLGGNFGTVNGITRKKLAAVSPTTGATLGWAPAADNQVNSMTKTPDGSRIIVGGMFATVNGSQVNGLASIDAANGTLYPFAANQVIKDYGTSAAVYSLKSDATNVYGTGYWYGGTAGNFEGPFVVDPYTGDIKAMADCHGDTYDSSVVGSTLYSVSHHHDCSNIGGFPDTNPRSRWARANAFTLEATTTVRRNTVSPYFDFSGQPSPSLVNWFPEVAKGDYTGQGQGGWTSESTSEYLVQGGEFPRVNGTLQQGLVRFAIPSLAPKKQGPRIAAADSAPALRGISGNTVRVSWPSNWDRDDQKLTYKLYRTNRTATPLVTQTTTSQFWNLPTQTFIDSGLTPGATYGYYVVVSDPDGNTVKSTTTSITTGTSVVEETPYSQAVLADGSSHYWRLDESAGTPSSIDWAGGNDLLLGSGVALGTPGAINGSTDPAVTFDGTANGTAGQSAAETGTNTFSTEAWFKTTTTSGGKIVGFGNSQLGTSNNYDRHVYMDNGGRLVFGVCCDQGVSTIATPGSFNDGSWHQVVSTLSSGGMKLYVDGILEASNVGVTTAQPFDGYWRVGGDNLNSWPYDKASNNFAGAVDDVAVYPTALTVTQIRDHFTKSGRSVNLPSEPADAYGKQVYNDNPSLFWRLDEKSGTAVADSSQSRTPGDAFGGVTFGADSPVAPGTAAAFNGSDGVISSGKRFSNPRNYSEELWFKTTTTSGGKLIGFGDQRSTLSGNYDRHVYMEDSGRLTFGVWTGQTNLVTSDKSYNDGAWHHLVASQDTVEGQKLYVDGALVGTNSQTGAQGYDGYWRIGGDSSWGGSSRFLNGTLDEVAVYPYALTGAQVRSHYQASGAAVNAAPVAAFTASCDGATCSVDSSSSSDPDGSIASVAWDFGDGGTATTATATHDYKTSGSYDIQLTVKDDKGKTASLTRSVTVTVPANQPPVAAFTAETSGLAVSVDGSTSSDPDGTVSTWAWSYGDGGTGTGKTDSHTYTAAGTYTVTLEVTDAKGATDTTTRSVTVAAANVKPTASFTSTASDLVLSVDASGSTDPDGTVASYAWSYGDGATGTGKLDSHPYAAAGTYSVTLTVTDDRGATDATTKVVTVAAPSAVVAKDTFSRTGTRWGSADTGGAWTDAGTSYFSTNGSQGLIRLPNAGNGPTATLGATSAQDTSTLVDFSPNKLGSGGGTYVTLSSRKVGTSEYRVTARLLGDGSIRLGAAAIVSGTTVASKEVVVAGQTYAAGDVLRMRFDVTGNGTTTMAGKVWSASAAEPATPQVTLTNTAASLQAPGASAIQGYLSGSATNAPVVLAVDNYSVTRVG